MLSVYLAGPKRADASPCSIAADGDGIETPDVSHVCVCVETETRGYRRDAVVPFSGVENERAEQCVQSLGSPVLPAQPGSHRPPACRLTVLGLGVSAHRVYTGTVKVKDTSPVPSGCAGKGEM